MSLFEDFVNLELPRRTVMTTDTVCGYSGNPNDAGAPDMLKNSPKGTYYLRESNGTMWYKKTSAAGTWELIGTSGGGGGGGVVGNEYWVDQVAGSDSNPGTLASPFATLGKALGYCPATMTSDFTVWIKKGTYAETAELYSIAQSMSGVVSYAQPRIKLMGLDWDAVVPATGPATGTFDGATGKFATLTAAGWTVNNLRGKHLKITSGGAPYEGTYWAIASNTATGIEMTFAASPFIGRSFAIVTPAAVITKAVGKTYSVNVGKLAHCLLDSLTLNPGSLYGAVGVGYLSINKCLITGATYGLQPLANFASVSNTFVNPTTVGAYVAYVQYLSLYAVVLHGGTSDGLVATNLRSVWASSSDNSGVTIQNFTGNGISLTAGTTDQLAMRSTTLRGNGKGISCYGGVLYIDAGNEITGNVGEGIYAISVGGRGSNITIGTGNQITSNGTDGIALHGAGHQLSVQGTANIANNGRYGVNLAGTDGAVPPGMNGVAVAAAVTMSGNVSGDINMGASAISVATLRAEPDKTYVDTARLNRAASL